MRSIVWIIIPVLALGLVGGFFALGAFPPEPKTETVQKVLPNERFGARP